MIKEIIDTNATKMQNQIGHSQGDLQMKHKNRIESLDWLRGLMALSIMLFHLGGWLLGGLLFFKQDASTFLGRLGVYGVSIFFVLSGLSMEIVYNKYIKDIRTSLYFFIRRIFRIWLLMWVALFMIIIPSLLFERKEYSTIDVVLNLTTLFGFIKPAAYIPTGAWSIGNKMVYYAMTPLIIIVYNWKKLFGNSLFLCSIFVGIYVAEFMLMPSESLTKQWYTYINPFNNLFLYMAGIAIYYNLKNVKMSARLNAAMITVSWMIFITLPFNGDLITITTGIGRIIFSALSIYIVILFYKINYPLPKIIVSQLERLGIATYSVYLLHPVINSYVGIVPHRFFNLTDPILQFSLTIISTIIIALIAFRYIEKPFINMGKK